MRGFRGRIKSLDESKIVNEIKKMTEILNNEEMNQNDAEVIHNLQNIVQDIEEKVNNESITSRTNNDKTNSLLENGAFLNYQKSNQKKSHPSLAYRMGERFLSSKKSAKIFRDQNLLGHSSSRSGNNPLYNYPKIPPALVYDPKYSRNSKENFTKFATTATVNGKTVNFMETIDRLYDLQKQHNEKIEAQRFLKYQEESRENMTVSNQIKEKKRNSKSVSEIPLYKRSYGLQLQKDLELQKLQNSRVQQLEDDFESEMESHNKLSVHNKINRKKFTQKEWQEFYKERFTDLETKRIEGLGNKREKFINEVMKHPRHRNRASRGVNIEDRLLDQGEKYKEKKADRQKAEKKKYKTRIFSSNSKKILAKRNRPLSSVDYARDKIDQEGSNFAAAIEAMMQDRKNFINKGNVVGDCLNVPRSTPGQIIPETTEREDDFLHSYANEINQMSLEPPSSLNYDLNDRYDMDSRQRERIDQYRKKSPYTTEEKYQFTMGSSVSNFGRFPSKYANQFSDDSRNKINETNTIEKVINGDYADDENVNYYSIGSKSFGVKEEQQKDSITTPDVSDPIIDPFGGKSDEDLLHNEEYDHAKFHRDRNQHHDDIINVQDFAEIYDHSREINGSSDILNGSFDNSMQMQLFLKSLKNQASVKNNVEDDFDQDKDQELNKLIQDGIDIEENILDPTRKKRQKLSNYSDQYSRPEIKEDDQKYSPPRAGKYRGSKPSGSRSSRVGISLSDKDMSDRSGEEKIQNISILEDNEEIKNSSQREENERILDGSLQDHSDGQDNSENMGDSDDQRDHADRSDDMSPTLEMIQEETENAETTKIKESDFASAEKTKYISENLLREASNEGTNQKSLGFNKTSSGGRKSDEFSKKREEIIQKVMGSSYSSMSSNQRRLFESLDLNKQEMQELENLGLDAMSIIASIVKQFAHVFESKKKKRKCKNEENKISA
ncbi:unnamed protein product [Moneuplotes crassus]|uniref:Uncharacterized protein n=1 Tax=Euplotes crassus TaxID=5936 RepID=A0AAD2D1L5_EUPCR|nr:unnamed protein product [Moneuplotes crassus]